MKKFLSFVFIFVVAITLTGCGKKTITCEGDITEGNITSAVKVTGNFENDKLKSQNIEMIFDMTDFLQFADIHTYYNAFKEQYETFNDYEGITSTVSQGENTIKVVMEVDLENVDEETYKRLDVGNGSLEVSSKAYIEEFKDMGLTCNK
mgnify:FL=1